MKSIKVLGFMGQEVACFTWNGEKVSMIIYSENPLDKELMTEFYNIKEWFDPINENYRDDDSKNNFEDFLNKIGPKLFEYCYNYKLE